MTKVAVKGPATGTGTYTLRAPETASILELELPLQGTHLAGAQSDGMPLGPGGDPVVESGSNTDGEWTRWAEGTQLCTGSRTLAYVASNTIQNDWPFPVAFTGFMRVIHQPDSVNLSQNTAPSLEEIGLVSAQGVTTTSCTLQIRRIAGMTSFLSGDTGVTRALATGRWK